MAKLWVLFNEQRNPLTRLRVNRVAFQRGNIPLNANTIFRSVISIIIIDTELRVYDVVPLIECIAHFFQYSILEDKYTTFLEDDKLRQLV